MTSGDNSSTNVMVVNAGSGSLKLSVLDRVDHVIKHQTIDAPPDSDEARQALSSMLDEFDDIVAVGHRFVHGGPNLDRSHNIDAHVQRELEEAADLAPLHMPPALVALQECRDRLPDTPQIACFDTAFHFGMPEVARTYAIPLEWREKYGLRRYGFHGLSYAWSLSRAAKLLGKAEVDLQIVLAHLGGGSSVCAVAEGQSVWTSMGFTPLEGLVMVSRSGSIDPGMLLWLQTARGLSAVELAEGLEHRSGLLGLSDGISGDTRVLVREAGNGAMAAKFALDVYSLRARQEVAAAAASLDRLDALVFTGEIGSDQPEIRESIAGGLSVLGLSGGLEVDQDEDRILSDVNARVPVIVIMTGEDRQIAVEVRSVLRSDSWKNTGDHLFRDE